MAKDQVDLKQVDKVMKEEQKRVEKLMLELSPQLQQEIVERVLADVETDTTSRKPFMERRQEIIDAYEGKKSPKNDPFPGCANVKTMITAMVTELLHAKLYPAVYNPELTYWVPQEKSDIQTAENVGKFMKWALRDMQFGAFVDDYTKNLVLEGTAVAKIRWDIEFKWVQRKIRKETSKIKQMTNAVMNLFGQRITTKIEDNDFAITYEYKKFEMCKCELIPLEDVGFPVYSAPGSDESKLRHIWHRTYPFIDEIKGKEEQGYFQNTDRVGSGIEEQIKITGTTKVKMEAEGSKLPMSVQKADYPLEQIEWYGCYDIPGKGKVEIIAWVEKKTKTFLGAMLLVNMSRINKRPFVIGQLIKRMNRMYGMTVNDFIKELEEEANAIHNQRLDAGTMSIVPPGVYRAASGFTPEEIQLRPGLWVPVDDVNDMKYLIMPNNVIVSFQEEKMLMELIEKITSAGAYQSGQDSNITRTRSTARGTLALIAQGEQRFMVLAKRVQISLAKILENVLQQFQQNIPPGLENRILGDTGEPVFPEGVSPEDIAGNYDASLTIDSTGGSKSMEQQVASMVYQGFIQNPLVASNPAHLWEVSADALKAAGRVDIEKYIGPKPKQPTDIAKSVQEENMLLMQAKDVKTSPNDNVIQHLIGHLYFAESPSGLSMTPEAHAKLEEHVNATRTQLIQAAQQHASQMPPMMGGMNAEQGPDEGIPGVGGMEGTPQPTPQIGNPAAARPSPGAPPQGGIQGVPSGIGL